MKQLFDFFPAFHIHQIKIIRKKECVIEIKQFSTLQVSRKFCLDYCKSIPKLAYHTRVTISYSRLMAAHLYFQAKIPISLNPGFFQWVK